MPPGPWDLAGVELVGLAVAIMALLLLLAASGLFRVIAGVLSHVPVLGDTLSNVITTYLVDTMNTLAESIQLGIGGIAEWFWGIGQAIWAFVQIAASAAADAKNWAFGSWLHANNLHDSVINTVTHDITQAVSGLQSEINTLSLGAGSALADAEAYTRDLLNSDYAALTGQISDVISEANSLFGEAEAFTQAQVQQAEALAHSLADTVQSEAVSLFGQAEGAITGLQEQVQALPGIIEGTIPGIIDGVVPGLIAGAIPGILSLVLPRVVALEGEADTCLKPLCDTVTPNAKQLGNLGNLFKNLEDLGIEALLIALAAEAVHNPQAVVSDVTAVVQDVGGGALAGYRDLVGV